MNFDEGIHFHHIMFNKTRISSSDQFRSVDNNKSAFIEKKSQTHNNTHYLVN